MTVYTESTNEICRTCRFWLEGNRIGTCKRYPPIIVGPSGVLSHYRRWPLSYDNDYCGEYRPTAEEIKKYKKERNATMPDWAKTDDD